MIKFPNSSQENLILAKEVIAALQTRSGNSGRWTEETFAALERVAELRGCAVFHKSIDSRKGNEFLWDFTAFLEKTGLLFTVESELWTRDIGALYHDFEKLLYARCPVKVMVFAVNDRLNDLHTKLEGFEDYLRKSCTIFSPGEVYIIYAADGQSVSRDAAYIFQSPGEPNLQEVSAPLFKLI